ncbi:SAM-dependent chlorinase/fluorinase [Candidatus Woesearchaeota archaeon]|nr:SAM-dependent chlorinase/fluorinase [Candidatus Woesearchaeota archaeon]
MIVTLTDFGESEYLGAMKGMIYSISPDSRIADLCNNVSCCSVREGAWILYKNYMFFPKGSIFLCVADPGVGGQRKCIAARTKDYYFVGPDNGLMHKAMAEDGIAEAVALPAEGASKTFHGRDVFAKAAAMLDKGTKISQLGPKAEIESELDFHLKGREGEVVRIDHFGNIITNLPSIGKSSYMLRSKKISKTLVFCNTYEEGSGLFAIVGSGNTLEISVKGGSAAEKIPLKVGDMLELL